MNPEVRKVAEFVLEPSQAAEFVKVFETLPEYLRNTLEDMEYAHVQVAIEVAMRIWLACHDTPEGWTVYEKGPSWGTHRLRVPGGYIYRVAGHFAGHDHQPSCVFVPDPNP